jgi:hypothetical protein
MKTFEYRIERIGQDVSDIDFLNQWGKLGWEVVAFEAPGSDLGKRFVVLKRETDTVVKWPEHRREAAQRMRRGLLSATPIHLEPGQKIKYPLLDRDGTFTEEKAFAVGVDEAQKIVDEYVSQGHYHFNLTIVDANGHFVRDLGVKISGEIMERE